MRRRFGRRRERSGGREAIDAARWLGRVVEAGVVAAARLEPVEAEGVPGDLAALGEGEAQDGSPIIVGFSPRSGGDALLGALALAAERAAGESGFSGEALAIAPVWSGAARRRLAWVGELPFRLRALESPALGDGSGGVEPEPSEPLAVLLPQQVGAQLVRAEDRALFERAAAALEGLASKHGGSVRGTPHGVDLVVLARRVAELRVDEAGVLLHALAPERSQVRLSHEELSGALDRLEGQLRRRLSDRKVRDGEDGLRSRALPLLAQARGLRSWRSWPLAGSDPEVIDLAGVDAEGRAVVGAVRERWSLAALGELLDALSRVRPALPWLLASAGPPLRLDQPSLALAGTAFDAGVVRVLPHLVCSTDLFEVRLGRGDGVAIAALDSLEGAAGRRPSRPSRGRERGAARLERDQVAPEARAAADEALAEPVGERAEAGEEGGLAEGAVRRGGRRRGRRRGRARSEAAEGREEGDEARSAPEAEAAAPRFEELSLFDLEDESEEGAGARRRRGGRSRRRGRRGGGRSESEGAGESEAAPTPDAAERERGRGRRPRGRERAVEPAARADEAEESEDAEDLEALVSDLPELEEAIEEPRYDEEEDLGEEGDDESDRLALERERRRLARLAKASPEPEQKPREVRRRAAVVAHADRDSVLAAVLLARDVRLLEGFWVYPQSELMTFFRSVATDLKEGTPIHVVGFTPSPARDVLQAVGLYGERVSWYDHHDWPPEDVMAVRQVIGEDQLHLAPGTGSSLPPVLATSSRRSRFSDKLVDLAAGRFTHHDYERWGRLWWARLGRIAESPGERRADVEPLLAGRPSDLAKEAARVPKPPLPAELEFASTRDFRLVYFSGFTVAVVEVPAGLDSHLAARIVRERYGAVLSLAHRPGQELVELGADDAGARQSLDLGAMVEHLAEKLGWVEALPDEDHVARMRIRGLQDQPERLDELIGAIAMSRSILER